MSQSLNYPTLQSAHENISITRLLQTFITNGVEGADKSILVMMVLGHFVWSCCNTVCVWVYKQEPRLLYDGIRTSPETFYAEALSVFLFLTFVRV